MDDVFGKDVSLLGTHSTYGERKLISILESIGVTNIKTGFAYPTPYRRNKFDIAVFADGEDMPSLLIDYIYEEHDIEFYRRLGNRPCRNEVCVLKSTLTDVKKQRIAMQFGARFLCFTHKDLENEWHIKRLLMTYVWVFVDKDKESSPEVSVARMCEKYWPEMVYVRPKSLTKKEAAYLRERVERGLSHVECDSMFCEHGESCPYNLDW